MSKERLPCRGCDAEKPPGSGRSYCDNCEPREQRRRRCARCGGAKAPGKGRQICARCAVGSRVSKAERRQMVRMYEGAGLSLAAISARVYWSAGAVRSALLAEGVKLRRPGAVAHKPHPRALSEDEVLRAVEMYLGDGLSRTQIAERLGLKSEGSIKLRLCKAGVSARPAEERFWLRRLSEIAEHGVDAMTVFQRAAFLCLEECAPESLTTPEVARRTGINARTMKVTLRRLDRMGLVRGSGRIKTGKAHPRAWTRTELATVDVLREALRPPLLPGNADVKLDAGPLRDWVQGLIAVERRKLLYSIITDAHKAHNPENSTEPQSIVYQRLGATSEAAKRRLFRLLYEADTVPFATADRLLSDGNGPPMDDLWPHLARDVAGVA